jgi:hypothetical protein
MQPMAGAQKSYLKTLCEEANQPFDDRLTKAEASKRIEEMQALTERGKPLDREGQEGEEAGSRWGPHADPGLHSTGTGCTDVAQ